MVKPENPEKFKAFMDEKLSAFLQYHRQRQRRDWGRKQIEALTEGLQKVSTRLEASKFATGRIRGGGPAPQAVNNP